MTQLKIENVSMSYKGRRVLENVSFKVKKGDYLFVLGENGTGKTTLIKGLLGFKTIDRGTITFDGGISKRDIGYLSQSTDLQKSFPATVNEIILSGLLGNKGFSSIYNKADRKNAEELMEKLGVAELKNSSFSALSGGQQQRVLLCRALASATKVLVLDEPTAFLDAKSAAEMYETLERQNREEGLTVIMVSHDFSAAAKYASHILYIKSNPLYFGKSEDFFVKSGFGDFGGIAND